MKISYCTNCHNRLWQLQQTLPTNLTFTKVGEVELCVLAYNDSSIEAYLKEHYSDYINSKRLIIKTHIDIKPYSFGYVKNLNHAMGQGHILFNLDADNFIEGVHEELLELKNDEILVTNLSYLKDGRGGRIGISRDNFNRLQGYKDNQQKPDDDDFIYRSLKLGLKLKRGLCIKAPLSNTN